MNIVIKQTKKDVMKVADIGIHSSFFLDPSVKHWDDTFPYGVKSQLYEHCNMAHNKRWHWLPFKTVSFQCLTLESNFYHNH
ncbi:hypothetical protein wVul_1229 [Wolbachia endosymbiont of Armadillidium vulgare str. wVulC]|nr:hypothetical protein wVul_1229 [Wolbachia endosymbiont of Armadillidium vulgare str. wVulC]